MTFKPTQEQNALIELAINNATLRIDAGAGAAKTTSLVMIANEKPAPSLYLAFNKAMAEEAKAKFPAWVEVRTTHSLAYREFGIALQHKLSRPTGAYVNVLGTGLEISRYFKLQSMSSQTGKKITAAGIGLAIKETVNNFEYSADEELTVSHVSLNPLRVLAKYDAFDKEKYISTVLSKARQLWDMRKDPASPILATHDTYLKLFQLSHPSLTQYENIYLDEGQDTNKCVLALFQSFQGNKVIVGDADQQLYGWRGSMNAMRRLSDWPEAILSTSFRFGQDVADIANVVLGKKKLTGWEALTTEVHPFKEKQKYPDVYTKIFRTNAALLMEAVDQIGKGKSINLEVDYKDFLRLLESAVALKEGRLMQVKHESLLCYDTWSDLKEDAILSSGELFRTYLLIEGGDHERVVKALQSHRNSPNAKLTYVTAHKSKGREWDNVVLADDFPTGYDKNGEWVGLEASERFTLYVAATRPKKNLWLNVTIDNILREE